MFIRISVVCFTFVCVQSEWTGSIKQFLDSITLTTREIKSMSENSFGGVGLDQVCPGVDIQPMDETKVLSSPALCDSSVYNALKFGTESPEKFDGQAFLSGLWGSEYGKSILQEFRTKGASEDLLKKAVEETWFNVVQLEDGTTMVPFRRIFLGNPSEFDSRSFESWYTFHDMANKMSEQEVRFKYRGDNLPQVIIGYDGNLQNTGYFVYPSHPYVDLLQYTLCAWRSDASNDCLVTFPGNKIIHVLGPTNNNTQDGFRYLYGAVVRYLKS